MRRLVGQSSRTSAVQVQRNGCLVHMITFFLLTEFSNPLLKLKLCLAKPELMHPNAASETTNQ